eukprot:136450-Karenia_brevis.AAC.1
MPEFASASNTDPSDHTLPSSAASPGRQQSQQDWRQLKSRDRFRSLPGRETVRCAFGCGSIQPLICSVGLGKAASRQWPCRVLSHPDLHSDSNKDMESDLISNVEEHAGVPCGRAE